MKFSLIDYQNELSKLLHDVSTLLHAEGITYYGMYGTCLGAIRHKGFIPWDDDIDIALQRDDYEHALAVLRAKCPDLYVWDWHVDGQCDIQIARVYRRLKDGMTNEQRNAFIDLFPIDNAPKTKIVRWIKAVLIVAIRRLVLRKNKVRLPYKTWTFSSSFFYWVAVPFACCSQKSLKRIFQRMIVQRKQTGLVWIPADYPKRCYPASLFNAARVCQFGNGEITIPLDAETVMQIVFGDWRQLPPEEKRYGHAVNALGEFKMNAPADMLRR